MDYETIVVDHDQIYTITLNRPERRNAFSGQMISEIRHALTVAKEDDSVHVVVLRGAGPIFSSGHDLVEVNKGRRAAAEQMAANKDNISALVGMTHPYWVDFWEFPKPIVAAVQGYLGPGAIEIVNCCDITVAASGTIFSFQETRTGGVPYIGLSTMILGLKRVSEWQMLGAKLTAETAREWGLINRVVPVEKLDSAARHVAMRFSHIPLHSLVANKQAIHAAYELMGVRSLAAYSAQMLTLSHASVFDGRYKELILSEGLRAALSYRDAPHEELGGDTL